MTDYIVISFSYILKFCKDKSLSKYLRMHKSSPNSKLALIYLTPCQIKIRNNVRDSKASHSKSYYLHLNAQSKLCHFCCFLYAVIHKK